jgi:hypothetical protein
MKDQAGSIIRMKDPEKIEDIITFKNRCDSSTEPYVISNEVFKKSPFDFIIILNTPRTTYVTYNVDTVEPEVIPVVSCIYIGLDLDEFDFVRTENVISRWRLFPKICLYRALFIHLKVSFLNNSRLGYSGGFLRREDRILGFFLHNLRTMNQARIDKMLKRLLFTVNTRALLRDQELELDKEAQYLPDRPEETRSTNIDLSTGLDHMASTGLNSMAFDGISTNSS